MKKIYKIQYKNKWYEVDDNLSIKIKLLLWPWLVSRQCQIKSIHEDGIAIYKPILGNRPEGTIVGNITSTIKLTHEEEREKELKDSLGKHIVCYKAKTIQFYVLREPQRSYTEQGNSYISHYLDVSYSNITSSETIEGTLVDVNPDMLKIDNNWYAFGSKPERIYDYKIINERTKLNDVSRPETGSRCTER